MARTCAVSSIAASPPLDFFSDQHTSGVSRNGGENAKCNTAVREPAANRACNMASKQSRPDASTNRRVTALVCSSNGKPCAPEHSPAGRLIGLVAFRATAATREPKNVNAVHPIAGSQSTADAAHEAPGSVKAAAVTADKHEVATSRRNEPGRGNITAAAFIATNNEVADAVDKSSGRCIPPANRRHASRIATPLNSTKQPEAAWRKTKAGIVGNRRRPPVDKSRSACMRMTKLRLLTTNYRCRGATTLPRRPSPPLRRVPRLDWCFPT